LLLYTGIHKNIALCKTVKVSHFELKLHYLSLWLKDKRI
jgi:hypothetical protein